MKKIVVIIDALKDVTAFKDSDIFKEYNQNTIIPPFSFKPEAAFLTGYSPEKTDSGTMYIMDEKTSYFKNNFLIKFLPENPYLLRKIIKVLLIKYVKFVKKINSNKKIDIGFIPFKLLSKFSLSHDFNFFDSNCNFKYDTIFNKLKNKDKKYLYVGEPFISGRLENIRETLSTSDLNNNNIFFLYITDLDAIGHKFGGSSKEYSQQLAKIINYLEEIAMYLKSKNLVYEFLIFGDHGMVDIKRTINIKKEIERTNFKINHDYIYFLDSTLARFWFKNEQVKQEIKKILSNDKFGNWISDEEKKEYQINFQHDKFGEEIWWASGGTLISPNFWQGTNFIKGMHGYKNEVIENNTMVLYKKEADHTDDTISMMELNKLLIKFLDLN